MIRETLGKAHADGVLQGVLVTVLVFWGKSLPSPWCWIALAVAFVLTFVVYGLNRRFKKIDKGEWPTAYYDGKHFDPLVEDGDENGK